MNVSRSLTMALALAATGVVAHAQTAHDGHHTDATPSAAATAITAEGVIKTIDKDAGKLVIDHAPIAALNWPAMSMDFRLQDPALADTVKEGDKVNFEMVPGGRGTYVITAITPAP